MSTRLGKFAPAWAAAMSPCRAIFPTGGRSMGWFHKSADPDGLHGARKGYWRPYGLSGVEGGGVRSWPDSACEWGDGDPRTRRMAIPATMTAVARPSGK